MKGGAAYLKRIGVTVCSICPLSYCANTMVKKVNVMTCSNKLRTYSHSKFYSENEFIDTVAGAVLTANWTDYSMPVVDGLGDEFLEFVREGMTVTVEEDGTVIVEE